MKEIGNTDPSRRPSRNKRSPPGFVSIVIEAVFTPLEEPSSRASAQLGSAQTVVKTGSLPSSLGDEHHGDVIFDGVNSAAGRALQAGGVLEQGDGGPQLGQARTSRSHFGSAIQMPPVQDR